MRFFNLYSNILVTKGYRRILISDLGRNISKLYPLELSELIEELKESSIEAVLDNYDEHSKRIVQEYVDYLIHKEYGFITEGDWDRNFIPLSLVYQDSRLLSDIFLELEQLEITEALLTSITKLRIRHVVAFCRNAVTAQQLIDFDALFANTAVEGVEIYTAFSSAVHADFFQRVHAYTKRISHLVFYGCDEDTSATDFAYRFMLDFTSDELSVNACGKINVDHFNTNMPKVLEAVNHNSCLHKKIGIDIDGRIKNCPAMSYSFGHINEVSLEDAFDHQDFKKYWSLTKDAVLVCKDCEFRNVCTDCRAFTERSHYNDKGMDISKPLKCGYDPYTNEWSEWSLNPLKRQAMAYYGFKHVRGSE
ncbi:grasp-with-spasm system SPASM domain peptide maturase [Sphingobacterium suaedae]|uniref:Grasp-with-spasm system SPASM domain peptide maturase n=1 Tax=Sphingobacterium suaedae TaxID=1686402 RepID=A0ABW5KG88_9SPHI